MESLLAAKSAFKGFPAPQRRIERRGGGVDTGELLVPWLELDNEGLSSGTAKATLLLRLRRRAEFGGRASFV